jgi:PadR family transcriptional regulator, regulatory protein PadR
MAKPLNNELKRGSVELLLLSLLEQRERHGYELAQLIESGSSGSITFYVASLYPILYRLEDDGLIEGKWVEKATQRRRRYYKITRAGRKALSEHRKTWLNFFDAVNAIARILPRNG